MAGIDGYDPSVRGTNLKYTDWAATIEVPAYENMEFIPTLDDIGRPYSAKKVRFWDELAVQTLAATSDGNNSALTFSDGTPSVSTLSPSAIYVAVSYPIHEQDYVETGLDPGIRSNIEGALAAGCDYVAGAAISSLTLGIGDAAYVPLAADFRKLVTQLRIGSPKVKVGQTTINATLHPGALEGLQNIPEWMNAEVRGDAENPQVRGIYFKAGGILFRFTTKVPTANGNGGEGAIYDPSAFGVGWNSRPKMFREQDGLATNHIGYANLGSMVLWNSRARFLRTVVSV